MALEQRRISGWATTILGGVLVIVAWVCFVLIAARPEVRFIADLTPNHTASLSPATYALVEELGRSGARVEIATFYEKPVLGRNASRAERASVAVFEEITALTTDVLRQYNALGGDRLVVRHIDPKLNPDRAAEWRKQVGPVRGSHVLVIAVFRTGADGKESVRSKELRITSELANIDFGNPGPMPTKGQSLPRLDRFLGEEAISSAIKSLLGGGIPVVYLLEGHDEKLATGSTNPYDYTNLMGGLQDEGFKVSSLNLEKTEVPQDATVIACLEPRKEFTRGECERLWAYLRGGGRLFLNLAQDEWNRYNVGLKPFLTDRLGVELSEPNEIVLQLWEEAGRASVLEITAMNRNHSITRALFEAKRPIVMMEARELRKSTASPKPEGVSVDLTLLNTVELSWLGKRDHESFSTVPPPGSEKHRYSPRSVGALIDVEPREGVEYRGKVVLLGGRVAPNRMTELGSNLDFALNCFEWLAERPVAMPIRTNRMKTTMIDLGTDEDARAARVHRTVMLQVVYAPLGFLLLGLFVGWRRRQI